jgi:hypothetical protein
MHTREVRGGRLLIVATTFAATAAAASAASETRLVVSGAFHTTSARAVSAGEESCGFRTNARTLLYESEALRIGRGTAVARVEFTIPHYRGRGRYDARIGAPYGRTAVQVVTARDASTGAASGFYIATSGSVSVVETKSVGRRGHSGSVGGTVHARLHLQRGLNRLHLDGSWHCLIAPEANGG